jgi:hypothetical protein
MFWCPWHRVNSNLGFPPTSVINLTISHVGVLIAGAAPNGGYLARRGDDVLSCALA